MSFLDSDESCGYEEIQEESLYYDMLLEVPQDFITDNFNLTGLAGLFSNFECVLAEIYGVSQDKLEYLSTDGFALYGMLHKRYIYSEEGLRQLAKVITGESNYLSCPVFGCNCRLVPMGITDELCRYPVVGYCVKCNECYGYAQNICLDGAYFGRNLAYLFFLRFPKLELQLKRVYSNLDTQCGKSLFGFEISFDRLLQCKQARSTRKYNSMDAEVDSEQ